MVPAIPNSPRRDSGSFQKVVDAFLSGEGLPFSEILSAERIARVFTRHDCSFGLHGIYTTAITVWSFLSQVLRDGKEASCQAAVARVVSYCDGQGLDTPTADIRDRGQTLFSGFRRFRMVARTARPLRTDLRGAIYHVMAR